jgi:V/A-type H+-transporting ATPase subunit I
MSKLKAIAPKDVRRTLIKELTRAGCVEIGSSAEYLVEEEWGGLLEEFHDSSGAAERLSILKSARKLLDKHAPGKSGFLSPRRQISEREFRNETIVDEAYGTAVTVNELGRQLSAYAGEKDRLIAKKISLLAWKSLDVPLDIVSGKYYEINFGVSPTAGVAAQELTEETSSKGPAELFLTSSDNEQHYYLLLAHSGMYDEIMDRLKSRGFSLISFKDVEGTAAENISKLEVQIEETEKKRLETIEKIKSFAGRKESIEQAIDVFSIESERDQVLSSLAGTRKTLLMEGWVPKDCETRVAGVLDSHGCAYRFDVPEEEDDVPVLLHNNRFVTPFTMVTELYALPKYSSGLDPNPYMAPFFFIFYGIMTGDIMYGAMMILGSWYLLNKMRPAEGSGLQRMLMVGLLGGFSGIIWGLFFGGFFGNAITAFTGTMLGNEMTLKPIFFDPIINPMAMFIMSLAFGVVQICFGLCIKANELIKRGKVYDAVSDAGFHLLLICGAPLCFLSSNAGMFLMALGALGIVFTGGRANPNIFGKLLGGLGKLYSCTNYLTDVLSYSRLLGIGLAGSVIAQVMNTMSTIVGPSVIGWITFALIFTIGHVFNLLINLIGIFVHAARLQFIEFFNKFYEPGGRPFAPLFDRTKYVEIIKEAI